MTIKLISFLPKSKAEWSDVCKYSLETTGLLNMGGSDRELWRFIRSPGAHWQPLSRTFKWLLGEGAGDNALQPPLPACSYCVCVTECKCSLYVYLKTGEKRVTRAFRSKWAENQRPETVREREREQCENLKARVKPCHLSTYLLMSIICMDSVVESAGPVWK